MTCPSAACSDCSNPNSKFAAQAACLDLAGGLAGSIVGQVESLQVWEAAYSQLQLINRVVLHVKLLKSREVHQLVHVDSVVRDVEEGQVLEKFKILLRHVIDVHSCELGADCLVRQLNAARVKKEEAV
eukprot:CAMPEP_0185576026 /NCGR_PEP_ID=MMETSP0434-20130131/7054_1 /TAXON_ID=626734 ORGANISM="Favella taraikaensis, Strain Fe Narragansett Bay" /NCGR_SAMPLE_ID=MMETSP0434 /ASSEMBLY_ACC=CAM_ASM_000379 /LENGTH=127 /DNA_ID=CAMNT_0028193085 /DNA_START=2179 /DNA_END=2563 /DNA_ORIENTATION=-